MKLLSTSFVIGFAMVLTACGGGGGSSKPTPPTPELKETTTLGTVNTLTPQYTFNTTLAGSIQYTGSCTADTAQAKVGDNTVTFENLEWWKTYNDCAITVTAENGQASTALKVSSFNVIPKPIELAPITVTNTLETEYKFYSDITGTIQSTGSCAFDPISVQVGENSITFKNLEWWKTYNDCAITVTAENGQASTALKVSSFDVIPTPKEVAPIGVSYINTPKYTFSIEAPGKIQYTGSCTSDDAQAKEGENTITFKNLEWWKTHDDCALIITSEDGKKTSSALTVSSFDVIPKPREVAPIGVSNTKTPQYTFYLGVPGKIQYSGGCIADATEANIGNNTITFKELEWFKKYDDCSITIISENNKPLPVLKVTEFKVFPDLTETVMSGHKEINSLLLGYVYHSDVIGTAHFSGDCGEKEQPINKGTNTLEFEPLKWWVTYENCAITITHNDASISEEFKLGNFRTVYPATHPLADTGMDLCANFPRKPDGSFPEPDDNGNFSGFKVSYNCADFGVTATEDGWDGEFIIPAGQDATHGRDAQALAGTLDKIGDGSAGYDFTKLNEKGEELPDEAEDYACIKDNFTQLIWEVKNNKPRTDDLHSGWHRYYWYNSDPSTKSCSNMGRCDTEKFVEDVNNEGYCGLTNWRLPTYAEMVSIANVRSSVQKKLNSIENPILKNALRYNFLSSFVEKDSHRYMLISWPSYLYLPAYIQPISMEKEPAGLVLVSQPAAYQKPLNNDEKYEDLTDKTVLDKNTGLIWTRCPVESDGSNVDSVCNSNKTTHWDTALAAVKQANDNEFLGYSDWRLPSIQELTSLQAFDRIPMINQDAFPIDVIDDDETFFWSSTPSAYDDHFLLQGIQTLKFKFYEGSFDPSKLNEQHYSLLVRGGY